MPASSAALAELIEHGNGSDRAFVDGCLRIDWARTEDPAQRAQLSQLHAALRSAALRRHAALRTQIAERTLRGSALRRVFDDVPPLERDQFVEEVLGIAYPPLEEPALTSSELMTYAPSGYDEVVHALDLTQLGPSHRFLDIGAGLGKVAILAALLTGAASSGIELDPLLCRLGTTAAGQLGLPDVRLLQGDARHVSSAHADVVFMYLPFAGEPFAQVMQRLHEDARQGHARAGNRRFLCTGPLDGARYPDLTLVGPGKSWLNVYAWR